MLEKGKIKESLLSQLKTPFNSKETNSKHIKSKQTTSMVSIGGNINRKQ